jgi:response regulator RpfG family c-di-GMP phosphodiesterase
MRGPLMDANTKLKVLCVDDEPQVVAGLSLHLRRNYQPLLATSGQSALEMLQQNPTTAVIVSDMRMPGMDGAAFLSQARKLVPDAVRMLLTGQADIESAIAAVNHGQIFRFLTKPCPPSMLLTALDAAAEQHRLITAERVLLEETLRGSLKAVTDVLALTSPLAFGCAMRVKQHVADLAPHLPIVQLWPVDVAAMLCQLGSISLPVELAEKVYYGRTLTTEEAQMVARTPAVTRQLLGNIPRLEVVLEILANANGPYRPPLGVPDADPRFEIARLGGEMLKAAIDFDDLVTRGCQAAEAIAAMRGRRDRYDPAVLAALESMRGVESGHDQVAEVPMGALAVGMVLAEDVKTADGLLLSARGCEVTAAFVARVRNNRHSITQQSVRIVTRPASKREAS